MSTTTSTVQTISDPLADMLVDALQAEANRLRGQQLRLAGIPTMKDRRKQLRERELECHRAMAGINGGEGVARASA